MPSRLPLVVPPPAGAPGAGAHDHRAAQQVGPVDRDLLDDRRSQRAAHDRHRRLADRLDQLGRVAGECLDRPRLRQSHVVSPMPRPSKVVDR
jgi:hypothetical protein